MIQNASNKDEYLSPAQAMRRVPTKAAPSTAWRWMRKGILCRDGVRVRLQHVRIGGRIFTTQAWLEAFFVEVTEHDCNHFDSQNGAVGGKTAGRDHEPRRRTNKQRQRDIASAEAILREAGI